MINKSNALARILTCVKRFAFGVGAIYVSLLLILQISTDLLNKWPEGMIGSACLFFGMHALVRLANEFTHDAVWERLWNRTATAFAAIAMGCAIGAVINFSLHGAPAMTWPMRNEWRAHYVALGILLSCAIILIPPTLIWLLVKISNRS